MMTANKCWLAETLPRFACSVPLMSGHEIGDVVGIYIFCIIFFVCLVGVSGQKDLMVSLFFLKNGLISRHSSLCCVLCVAWFYILEPRWSKLQLK